MSTGPAPSSSVCHTDMHSDPKQSSDGIIPTPALAAGSPASTSTHNNLSNNSRRAPSLSSSTPFNP